MTTLAFFDQMNGVDYQFLSSTNFQLGIVDPDSSGLTSSQISSLQSSGKTLIGYLSIGEAENFRSYWQSSWNTSPPSFLMGQNPNWPGDYNVKYWDPAWQNIAINQAVDMAKAGYNGIMLDVVDAYTVSNVAAADGGITNARADMVKFVEAISAATKAINPNFKIIQNNALDLLTVNPDDPTTATNTAYLSHIDGVLAEETFYNGNSPASWSSWNVQYLEHAVAAGKDVLTIDYPTSTSAQQSAISQSIADGFVPFIGTLNLDSVPSVNAQIPAALSTNALTELTSNSSTVPGGTPAPGGGTPGSGGTPGGGGTTITGTQGLASYTPSEIASLATLYKTGGTSDSSTVLHAMVQDASNALSVAPQPVSTIVTSGTAAKTGQTANTGQVIAQGETAYSLAMGYEITGNTQYLTQVKSFLLSWAQSNTPIGDPIANAGLIPMFKAYDLIHNQFSSSEQATINNWMSNVANAIISNQAQAVSSGSTTATNNHESYALLEVGTIGAVLGNSTFIHYLTDNFQHHIGVNLQSIAGQPPYLGVDFQERDAYHYVAYNLAALGQAAILMDQLSHVQGNPYGINYNPFTVQVNGASIQNTLDALLPYASGEKQSLNEFQNSTNPNDATRVANGSLSSVFHPSDAIPALEAADYFGHTVNDPLMGHSYNLPQLTAQILQNAGSLTLPATMPDPTFLQNDTISPYDNPALTSGGGGTPKPTAPVTIKVPTYSGNHTYDGSAGNDTFVFYKHTGNTTINHFTGGDVLNIESKIYSSATQALSHVQYSGGNAVIPLDTGNSITLLGIPNHGLVASEFHIF